MDTQKIISALLNAGFVQKKIAARTGLTQGAISHLKTGRRKECLASTYVRLLKLYQSLPSTPSSTQ